MSQVGYRKLLLFNHQFLSSSRCIFFNKISKIYFSQHTNPLFFPRNSPSRLKPSSVSFQPSNNDQHRNQEQSSSSIDHEENFVTHNNSDLAPRLKKWEPGTISKSGKSGVLTLGEQEKFYKSLSEQKENYLNERASRNGSRKNRTVMSREHNTIRQERTTEEENEEEDDVKIKPNRELLYFDPLKPEIFLRFYAFRPVQEKQRIWDINMRNLTGYEKLEFLRQLLKMGNLYLDESWKIFEFMEKHHLMARLEYVDFHKILFLLVAERKNNGSSNENKYKVLKLIQWMKEYEHQPSASLYKTLIRFAKKIGNLGMALKLEGEMRVKKILLSENSLCDLISLCDHQGSLSSLKKATELWQEYHKIGSSEHVKVRTVLKMIDIYALLQNLNGIKVMLQFIQDNYGLLFEKCNQLNRRVESKDFNRMIKNAALKSWIHLDQDQEVMLTFKELLEDKNYDLFTISSMLTFARKKKDVGMAEDLLDLIEAKGKHEGKNEKQLVMNVAMYGELIVLLNSVGKREGAEKMFERAIVALTLDPIDKDYHKLQVALLKSYVEAKDYTKAAEYYEEMMKNNSPEAVLRTAYASGIEAYVYLKDLDAALSVLSLYKTKKRMTVNKDPYAFNIFDEQYIVNWFDKLHN